ncbi:nuclear transport factor 2 family protein [Rhodococcus sp. NPDC127530]|uniref:nuclear transport factor 2 family protein n=1 Tax=unclassified Rhodococcus (in: high G+C Gram-positive bacteria) TaxID=192944 RepID=UPI003631B9CF
MALEHNKEIASRYIAAYSDLTGEESAELLADEARIHLMMRSHGLPLQKIMTKGEYLALFPAMAALLPNGIRHEVVSMIGEGDWIAVESECFAELPLGNTYNNLFHFLLQIRDHKVLVVHEYTDFLHTKEVLFDNETKSLAVEET